MHKHPTPSVIKARITEALVQRGESIDSITMSIVYEAIDAGIKSANEQHDKALGVTNG